MSPWDEDGDEGVLDLMIESMRRESDGVMSLTLVDPEGGWLPAWSPGAHIDVGLPSVVRQYSLCGDPADRRRYTVAVLLEQRSRGGSEFVHRRARPGDLVEVGGPRNHFALEPADEYRFIAGGIGITPILPMLRQAEAEGTEWRLTYGGRTRASMAFTEALGRHPDRVDIRPEDEFGLLDLDSLLGEPREGTAVYCCGPTGLIDAVEARCAQWPAGALHLERFAAKDFSGLATRPVSVRCERSGLDLHVPASQSILDALEEAGVGVANACRTGVCGSCEVRVLRGMPEHRDSVRSGDGLDDTSSLAVCVSRAVGPELVLDI
ncbi:PDR/VanB family oxidoreductase [Streptomyces radicis]|uniref:Oxidoreductase n=1 Tax=Streptomyces radicis TaxID=1750517 RepID=A0A3A9X2R3_9ACTN|nr:PDR/VanB family oxidoreductase [Streptomyces radicis]RKN12807.1 oxidoreductase [Streptomyces radicis]RKN27428.1 oxidoreductase [Streptomyces radicis]